MSGYYKISDFAEKIGKHSNTVDRWFNDLERRQLHYVSRSEDGDKVYNDLDIEIGLFIRDRREEKWSLAAIYHELEDRFDLRPFPEGGAGLPQIADFESLQRQFNDQIQQVIKQAVQTEIAEVRRQFEEVLKQLPKTEDIAKLLPQPGVIEDAVKAQVEEIKKHFPQPKDPAEERQHRLDEWIGIERIKAQLRKEALEEWKKMPESEKMRKAGLFGLKKEEDRDKRDLFIQTYVDDHLEDRLKKEYELR